DVELPCWLGEAADRHLEQTELVSEALVWVRPPDEPMGHVPALPPRAFVDRRLILRKRNSAARRVIQTLLESENAFPPDVLEMDNLEAIKHAVEVGFRVSIETR